MTQHLKETLKAQKDASPIASMSNINKKECTPKHQQKRKPIKLTKKALNPKVLPPLPPYNPPSFFHCSQST